MKNCNPSWNYLDREIPVFGQISQSRNPDIKAPGSRDNESRLKQTLYEKSSKLFKAYGIGVRFDATLSRIALLKLEKKRLKTSVQGAS